MSDILLGVQWTDIIVSVGAVVLLSLAAAYYAYETTVTAIEIKERVTAEPKVEEEIK